MIGIYFSGTGNTRFCVERFVSLIDDTAKYFSIEDNTVIEALSEHETIVFGFPVYYSNLPKIVIDFILENKSAFVNKKVYIIITKGLFNALGVGYARRYFKECGAEYIGSSQFNMPDNIRDMFIMEIAFTKDFKKVIDKTDKKIIKAAEKFNNNKHQRSGLNPLNYILGFFLKILWFYPKTDKYITAPKINNNKCNGCGFCVNLCPMGNIKIVGDKSISGDKCTICYRCFSKCPTQALTILGRKVYNQYNFDNYNTISFISEVENNHENTVIVPIKQLPITTVIDEVNLCEITNNTVIARISETISAAAETLTKTIANKALKSVELYKMDIPYVALTKSKEVDGAVRAFSRGKNTINKNANLIKVDPTKVSKATAVANGVVNVMNVGSLVVGQYYMSEINSKLEAISKNIDKISDFQDREFKSRIMSLISRVGEISQFSSEIMENDEQRNIKLAYSDDLKKDTTELLGQVNITINDIIKKNPAPNYQDYLKCVDEINIQIEYQRILVSVLEKISELTYLLGKGSSSNEMCYSLFNKYHEQSVQTRKSLNQWHENQVKTLSIDLEQNRKTKTGIKKIVSAIPAIVDDNWNYEDLKNGLSDKIFTQKANNELIADKPKDVYDNNVQIIIKEGKYYYLPENNIV